MENQMNLQAYRYKCISFLITTFSVAVLFVSLAAAQTDFSKEITISGETGLQWVNTGITVVAGDTVRLRFERR